MSTSSIRVLVVDDYVPWRRFVCSTLEERRELIVIDEASDGLEAVQKAQQLQPDLILLDIGLPKLNGIEVARRIRERSSKSTILFFSENRSSDIVEEALGTGALGYVVKSDAAKELLPAVESVLHGKQFVSPSLAGHRDTNPMDEQTADHGSRPEIVRHHQVVFYSDDRQLLEHVSQFIGAALKAGNATIVVATDSHRNSLIPSLQAYGVDIRASIEQGTYIAVDAPDTLSTFMVNSRFDSVRFLESFGGLILKAANAAKEEHPRVAVFGEGADLLCKRGHSEAAIQDEELCNQLTKRYDVDILCGYSLGDGESGVDDGVFQRICAEHSAVYYQ